MIRVTDRDGNPAPELMVAALCSGDFAADFNWAALRNDYMIEVAF